MRSVGHKIIACGSQVGHPCHSASALQSTPLKAGVISKTKKAQEVNPSNEAEKHTPQRDD